ncbi:MAG: Na+/H+ antiporter subunit E [Acidobacteriia bacterium]|nr:Na+/H+ antiporter subunit E [Terriglobia bacterium]
MRPLYWFVQFLALLALWFLFVCQIKSSEAAVGLGAAALAATAAEAVRGQEHPRFFPRLRWILDAWRIPGQIVRDSWLVARNLATRGGTGVFRTVPFEARGNDAHSVARRALAILYSTLPPNSIVIGIDRKRDTMLLHVLEERT